MRTISHRPDLPPAVRRLLDAVRRRIRAYVLIQGLALVVVLIGTAFWLGLAADWLFEPSPGVRRIGLVIVAGAALYVAYRYLLRRVFVRISDATAAILLERRFPNLREHLLTAVDLAQPERATAYDPQLVTQTRRDAIDSVVRVQPGAVFDRRPLARSVTAAGLLAVSILLFAVLSRDVFGFWLQRVALTDKLWPRRVSLEVLGFAPDATGHRVHKLAQDDDFELLARARAAGYEIPQEVEIRYRLADGRRGRDTMIRVGEAVPGRDEFQLYRYDFKRVAADMQFDVVGGDARVRDLELHVVDRPELYAIELECVYPGYLQREARRLPVTGGMRIPEGSRIVLHASATKPLTAAKIHTSHDPRDFALAFPDRPQKQLHWEYGTLTDDEVLLVSVTDTDNVAAREPYRVSLAVVRDEVPQVAVRLAGIGSAITPEAILPWKGVITDDYGLARVWYEYQVDGAPAGMQRPAHQPAGEPVAKEFDPLDLRAVEGSTGQRAVTLRTGQRFALSLKAADRYDLSPGPTKLPAENGKTTTAPSDAAGIAALHAGSSPQFTLDVVTMPELLALLERRELQLRQQYEAIYQKVGDTRNLLARVEFDDSAANGTEDQASSGGGAPETANAEKGAPADETPAGAARALARRRLRVAGSLQNIVQSADEISGVAEAFDDLHDQLTNNRIDNPDLKSRLREQIAQPLHQIAEQRMPQLLTRLKLVDAHLQDADAAPELARSLALADEILVEMRQVLNRMLELETYNEVLAQLRGIISDQQEISRQTKQRQKDRLRSLFEDEKQ